MAVCWSYIVWSTLPFVYHSVVKVCILALIYKLSPSYVEIFSGLNLQAEIYGN